MVIIPTRAFALLLVLTILFLGSMRAAGITLERINHPVVVATGALVR